MWEELESRKAGKPESRRAREPRRRTFKTRALRHQSRPRVGCGGDRLGATRWASVRNRAVGSARIAVPSPAFRSGTPASVRNPRGRRPRFRASIPGGRRRNHPGSGFTAGPRFGLRRSRRAGEPRENVQDKSLETPIPTAGGLRRRPTWSDAMGVSPKPRRRERKDCRAISGIPEWHASVSSQSARTKAAVSSVDPRRSPPQPTRGRDSRRGRDPD